MSALVVPMSTLVAYTVYMYIVYAHAYMYLYLYIHYVHVSWYINISLFCFLAGSTNGYIPA